MQPHQSFTDLCVLAIALGAGKLSITIAQVGPAPDWLGNLLGPLGALIAMSAGIMWLSARNKKMDEARDIREQLQDKKDAAHIESQAESIRIMTEAVTRSSIIIEQNNRLMETNTRALNNHSCTKS